MVKIDNYMARTLIRRALEELEQALAFTSQNEDFLEIPQLSIDKTAEKLIFAIGHHESGCWKHLEQTNGPALSYLQIEPVTVYDIYDYMLKRSKYRVVFKEMLTRLDMLDPDKVLCRLKTVEGTRGAVILARLKLFMDSKPLPAYYSNMALGKYAKRVWNTHLGKAKIENYVEGCEVYDNMEPNYWGRLS